MKKIIVMLSLGVLIAGASFAQNAPKRERKNRIENRDQSRIKRTPEERAARQTEMLSKKLDLSAKQKRKLEALNLKHNQELAALRTNKTGAYNRDRGQREEMQKLRVQWESELKDILNKKQYAQYEAERSERKNRRSIDGKGREKKHRRYNS